MGEGQLGVSGDHETLHQAARAFLEGRCSPAVARGYLDDVDDHLPPFWAEMGELGWLGIHLPERFGGGGAGLAELAVVLEEAGRVVAPGPLLPTVLAGAVVDRLGDDDQRAALLPGLAAGTTPAAVAFGTAPGALGADGTLTGTWPLVPGAGLAELVVVPARREDGEQVWCAVDRADLTVVPRPSVDVTRRLADISATTVRLPADRILAGDSGAAGGVHAAVEGLAVRLVAAEAVGVAGWCVATAAGHARVREQFGRPIGQFQAVKHRCADMLCTVELARAAAWDAVRGDDPVADVAAAALAPEAALRAAEGCVQVLGGMGFTWEHDAHLYLKRVLSLRSLVGPPARWRRAAVDHARSRGARAREGYPMITKKVILDELLVGTEGMFADAGFTVVSRPTLRRVVMRIDF